MTKKIFEELPARKTPPAAAPTAQGGDKKDSGDSEKRIKQAVYDIRYRAKQSGMDLRAAFASYMSGSKLSAQEQAVVKAKLFGKGKAVKEDYNSLMSKGVTSGVANALFKVFVEGQEPEIVYEEEGGETRKYKIRVTDEKTGRTYVRYADRSKITALREKGLKVEMTEHGEPKGEKKKGGLDPVAKNPAQRDGDVNNDGKKDKTDKYIYNRRDAINAAIAKRKGMKEEFLVDGTTSTEGQNKGKITGAGVDNYSTGVVKVMPENGADASPKSRKGIYAHTETNLTSSQRRLMEMIAKKNETPVVEEPVAEGACEPGKKCEKCGKDPCECDNRADRTYREVLKNKLRSMGKKVIAATGDDAEDSYNKMATAAFIKTDKMTGKMEPVSLYGEAMVMITDSLIEEGYSEDNIFDAIDNLTEEQVQQLEEGIGAAIGAGVRSLRNVPGVRGIVSKGVNIIKNVMRRGKAAKDLPAGQVGALRLYQDKATQSMRALTQKGAKLDARAATRTAKREADRLNNLNPRAVSDRNAREAASQVRARNKSLGRPEYAGPQPVDSLNYKPGDPQFTDALRRYYANQRGGVTNFGTGVKKLK